MAEELRTNPGMLAHLGAALADHGQSLLDLQQSCHRDADGAQWGWVGSSGRALPGLLDRWSAASAAQLRRVGEHSGGMHSAAAGFALLDQRNAAALR